VAVCMFEVRVAQNDEDVVDGLAHLLGGSGRG